MFRETLVPMYNCPSDFESRLALPHSGPAGGFSESSPNAPLFRTASYRGNAGRGDGFVTWYLYEDQQGQRDFCESVHRLLTESSLLVF